jgi:hypothetical protein
MLALVGACIPALVDALVGVPCWRVGEYHPLHIQHNSAPFLTSSNTSFESSTS